MPKSIELATDESPAIESSAPIQAAVQVPVSKDNPLSIDALSKWTAVILIFVYGTGFLITSLNDFRFGFTEMNPLRPRILAAGAWFTLSLAVPFAFVTEWRQHGLWKQNLSKWHKAALLLYAYYIVGNVAMVYSMYIFTFDQSNQQNSEVPLGPWKIAMIVILIIGVIIAVGFIVKYYSQIPPWIVATSIFGFYGWTIGKSLYDLFVRQMFLSNATSLWIVGTGAFVFLEMRRRAWKPIVGDWPWTLTVFFWLLTVFATAYYPHIIPKWGGGAPIPIEITLSKDAPVHAGQTVLCSLIDETDSGFYVVGKGEKHATFVPRSEISLVHFADGNEQSTFSIPSK